MALADPDVEDRGARGHVVEQVIGIAAPVGGDRHQLGRAEVVLDGQAGAAAPERGVGIDRREGILLAIRPRQRPDERRARIGDEGVGIRLAVEIVADQQDRRVRPRLDQQLAAQRQRVGQPEGVVAGRQVPAPPVALMGIVGRDAGGDALRKPARHEHAGAQRGVVVDLRLGLDVQLVAGAPGGDLDDAAGRVAAEQGALRPLEHGHLLDVGQLLVALVLVGQVDAVDIERDRILDDVARRADAADRGLEHAAAGGPGVEPGSDRAQRGQTGDARLRQLLAVDGGDDDRHPLQVLRATLRGDDDVANLAGFVSGLRLLRCVVAGRGRDDRPILRRRQPRRGQQRQRGGAHKKPKNLFPHLLSPFRPTCRPRPVRIRR